MKVHFTTLGCPKNQVDSELMLGMLTRAGHEIAEAAESADCLVVNTCAFIDRAREESIDTILELAQLKERGRARALIVTGCLTQRYGGEIQAEIPEVNAILGTSELHRIVELVSQADGRQAWVSQAPPGYQRAMVLEDSADLARWNPYVFVRGKASNIGPETPRQFLAALSSERRRPFAVGSGRKELAAAIADPANPLTARVLVNRVWGWHFGTGLVGTPNVVAPEPAFTRKASPWP